LIGHLRAAEANQLKGEFDNAAVENKAVLGIALQRLGSIAIEEGRYADAVRILSESTKYADSAANRTSLAIAYLRQNLTDKALGEVQTAVSLDPKHVGAHYILGNIYYTREDYKAALPELELVFAAAPDFEIARALGLTYLNLKQPEKARLHFEKMRVSAGKENADLHVLFARLYERTNYVADAEVELKRALAIEPNKPKTNFYLGYLLLQNGGTERLPEAGAAFERELKVSPNDFYSLFFSGVVASSLNDHPKAIPFLQKAIEINPKSGEAHLFLGQSQIEINDLANAEKNLRRAAELEANGGKNTQARRTHFMLGRLLMRTGQKEEGQKELAIAGKLQQESLESSRSELDRILGQVVEGSETRSPADSPIVNNEQVNLTPDRAAVLKKSNTFLVDVVAQAFNNLGVIAVQKNELAESMERFETAALWKPEFPGVDRNWGIVAFRLGLFEKAIGPLSRHVQAQPGDGLARRMLGVSYHFTKNYKMAVGTLKPIESGLASDPELAYFYGLSLVQLQLPLEAAAVFARIADQNQQSAQARFYAGQGFIMTGDFERALREFRAAATLDPQMALAHYNAGQSLIRLNRLADAEAEFRLELQISPADASTKYHLAYSMLERKSGMDEALALLREAIAIRYDYADARYQLGKALIEKGQVPEAIEQLEIAANVDPKKDYIHYQLSIAYRRAKRAADADRELKLYSRLKAENRSDVPSGMGNNKSAP
jgi:tetratricopeptide (TPR) repeat protein